MSAKPKIVVCCSASRGVFQRAIRWLTRSAWNHAYIAYSDPTIGTWQAIQLDGRGAVLVPARSLHASRVVCFPLPDRLYELLPFFASEIGKRYDWIGVFGFLVKIIALRVAGLVIRNPLSDTHKFLCSESVAAFLKFAHYRPFIDSDPDSTSPEDVSFLMYHAERPIDPPWCPKC